MKLMDETRFLSQDLSRQCRNFRAKFDKSVRLGFPSPFTGTGDIYAEDVYMGRIRIIMKDHTVLDKVHKPIDAKDMNQILKNCYDILSNLKEVFKMKNPPEYGNGAELDLTASLAEEFRYPLAKEWNLLMACLKRHKQNTEPAEVPTTSQQGESSSAAKQVAVTGLISQVQVDPQQNIPAQHAPGSASFPFLVVEQPFQFFPPPVPGFLPQPEGQPQPPQAPSQPSAQPSSRSGTQRQQQPKPAPKQPKKAPPKDPKPPRKPKK